MNVLKIGFATLKYIYAFIVLIITILYRITIVLLLLFLGILSLLKLIMLIVKDLLRGGYYVSKYTSGLAKQKLINPVAEAYISGGDIASKEAGKFQKISFKSKKESLIHSWNGLKGGKINNTYKKLKRQLGFREYQPPNNYISKDTIKGFENEK